MRRRLLCAMMLTLCVLGVRAAEVVWFDGQQPITYNVPKKVEPVVKTALEMWKEDMRMVTGLEPVADSRGKVIVAQSHTLPEDGFRISVKGGKIVIEGSNGRGMAYGLLELSRMAGVSPWVWWGDVVPEKNARLTMDEDFVTEQSPSVEYRGIFLNDEDWSLRPWSNYFEKGQKGQIGPKTYRKIFELLLRLRANAIWPAMHPGTTAFFKIPGAKAMADSCGIVIGTSHCEPLLRNNVDEWDVKQRGAFNYKTNREQVQQYWIERLQEVRKSKDNMFTIGMRGIHDGSMEGYKTTQEKLEGLQQVIDDQQELLRKYIGAPEKQMQVFVPYKEVLELYQKGLNVPDYVTLMWCDDNYGYMTRLSNAEEQQRQGGGGVYYHLSYWGRPHDYLWLTTTQPGLIYNEMREAYDHNVRKLWIVNVHDPKVAGYDLELFLDMAWNIDCVSGETLNNHLKAWLSRQFGDQAGERLFPVMHEFYRLCGERRPEFMGYTQVELDKKKYNRGLSPVSEVPLTAVEAANRLSAFEQLKAEIVAVRPYVRQELTDAFFAAIEYPVFATAAMNRKILSDSVQSHRAYEEIQALTKRYNEMNGGKWRYLMDAAPRKLPVFDDVHASSLKQGDGSFVTPSPTDVTKEPSLCYTEASEGVKTIQMLGHSMNAVALPKDGWLVYRFEVEKTGNYTLQTALIPTQPNDNGDLRYSVCIDGGEPTVFNLKEPFRSEEWKQNVLRGQALRQQQVHLSAGQHTLTIRALDAHIVVDQWSLQAQTADEVKDIIRKVNTYWQTNNPAEVRSFWDNAAYHTGNMEVYKLLKDQQMLDYSIRWAEYNQWKGATEPDPAKWKYKNYGEGQDYVLFGDWQICFQTYIDLYNQLEVRGKGQEEREYMVARAKEVMGYEADSEANDYWWWADALYMVMPVMTKMYKLTGDEKYLHKLYENILYSDSIMLDQETGLYFRDGKYVYPKHKTEAGKKDFWARGDGWVLAGLAKVLQDMPKTYVHQPFFVEKFTNLARGVKKLQQPQGHWTRSMMDPEQAPGYETSGTAFFCYGLLWGVNNGYLPKKEFAPTIEKAWNYLTTIALQYNGRIGYVQPIGERAIPGQTVDANSQANFGVGAFLLAACEYVKYISQ